MTPKKDPSPKNPRALFEIVPMCVRALNAPRPALATPTSPSSSSRAHICTPHRKAPASPPPLPLPPLVGPWRGLRLPPTDDNDTHGRYTRKQRNGGMCSIKICRRYLAAAPAPAVSVRCAPRDPNRLCRMDEMMDRRWPALASPRLSGSTGCTAPPSRGEGFTDAGSWPADTAVRRQEEVERGECGVYESDSCAGSVAWWGAHLPSRRRQPRGRPHCRRYAPRCRASWPLCRRPGGRPARPLGWKRKRPTSNARRMRQGENGPRATQGG